MPDFPLVDAHLHLYDPGRLSYPWMKAVPALDRPHLPADFRAKMEWIAVEAAVSQALPGEKRKLFCGSAIRFRRLETA